MSRSYPTSTEQNPMRVIRSTDGKEMNLPERGAPDTERPRGLCPRCGVHSSFEAMKALPVTLQKRKFVGGIMLNHLDLQRVTSLMCRGCEQFVVVIEENYVAADEKERSVRPFGYWRGIVHWPLAAAQLSADVPENIADVFAEAMGALAANLPRAATILARATLDAITLDKGEPSNKSLAKRLENLATRNVLQADLAEWATEVRLIGNESAHDPTSKVELSDAAQLLDFKRELLRYLYEMPAELLRRRAARNL